MSLEQITTAVENFISDTHNDLIVIKGKWGAGKTFFWQALIEGSRNKKFIGKDNYAYVSLFGINSLEELKNAILISVVESNSSKSKQRIDSVSGVFRKAITNLDKHPKLSEYTGGMISSFLHLFINNTLICFDDIERKGDGLDLKSIFGFASVLKEQRNCKVLLIMNDESFDVETKLEFKLHGEKIIDREIRFSITEEKSFSYVFDSSFPFHDLIKESCLILRIENIRILQRVKRFIEDISPYFQRIEQEVAEHVLRSLILFVWSYYDKENNAPPLEFILNYSMVDIYINREYKNEAPTPEAKTWNEILSLYNYFHTDDIDRSLAEFVKNGYLNEPTFIAALGKKNEQALAQQGDTAYSQVWNDIYRNSFDNNEDEFVDKLINTFRSNIKFLSFNDLQSAVKTLRVFERENLANALVDEYLEDRNSEKDIEALQKLKRLVLASDIEDEYLLRQVNEIWKSNELDKRSLEEVMRTLISQPGWNEEDILRLDSFSSADYYKYFKSAKSPDLYPSVRKCMEIGNFDSVSGIYKSVGEKAKEALLKIASESRINQLRVSTLLGIKIT